MPEVGIQLPSRIKIASAPETIQSAPFCSVPWLVSIIAVILVKILTNTVVDPLIQALAFAFIVSAPVSFIVTQYCADRVTSGDRRRLFPASIGALLIAGISAGVVGCFYFTFIASGDWVLKCIAVVIQIYATMNFVTLGFPAVFRKVRGPSIVLILGFGASIVGAKIGGDLLHTTGMMAGFAAGQVVLFILLVRLVRYEFGKGDGSLASWAIFHQIGKQRALAGCGLALAVGIWIDKLIPFPIAADWHIVSIAMLSTIPGIAFFFLHLRTDFTPAQSNFSQAIRNGETLETVRQIKTELTRAFSSGFGQLFGVQAVITLILIYYATTIGGILEFSAPEIASFRVALVGSFLLVIFLAMLSVLLFLDDAKGGLFATASFAVINLALTAVTFFTLQSWQGFGFVIASGVALLIAVFRVNLRLSRLEFQAGFTKKQPPDRLDCAMPF